jgi:hypothetical protein
MVPSGFFGLIPVSPEARCYRGRTVTVKKLSIALDGEVAAAAGRAAARSGQSLSAWLNDAAENALAIERGLEAVREWEAENGAFTAEELAEADRVLDDHARWAAGRR